MLNHRWMTGLIVTGLSVVAVPTLSAAHTHYTGRVPASIATDTIAAPTVAVPAIHRAHRAQPLVSHKKKAAAKHAARTKSHHKKHRAKKSA